MHKSRESTDFERKQLSCFPTAALLGLRRVRQFSWHYKTVKYNWKYFSYIWQFEISTTYNGSSDTQEIVMDNKSVCPKILGLLASEIPLWGFCVTVFQQLGLLSGSLNSGHSVLCFFPFLLCKAIEQFRVHAWVKPLKSPFLQPTPFSWSNPYNFRSFTGIEERQGVKT